MKENGKKTGGCLKTMLVIFGILIVIGFITSLFGSDDSDTSKDDTKQETTAKKTTKATTAKKVEYIHFAKTFGPGYYRAGYDFPAGTYNLKASFGGGNVISSDAGLNIIMGTKSDDMYTKTYNNASFSYGDTVQIGSTLKLKFKTSEKVEKQKLSNYGRKGKKRTLSPGKYLVGKNISAGIYDIKLVSGSGNVMSDDGVLNEIMGSRDSSMYIKKFMHAPLKSGTTLELDGVTVQITPSK